MATHIYSQQVQRWLICLRNDFLQRKVIFPVVPFRETIIEPPDTDMVNEEMNEENKVVSTTENQVKPLKYNLVNQMALISSSS